MPPRIAPSTPESLVEEVASRFPLMPSSWAGDVSDPASEIMRRRVAFDVELVSRFTPHEPTVVDLGGGMGLFAAAMAGLGARAILVDDHFDYRTMAIWDDLVRIWTDYGVDLEPRDVLNDGFGDIDQVDAITAFHLMEHLHNSPKALFRDAVARLKPGGVLVIAVPNAANLRKRIAIPLRGVAATPFTLWYDVPVYRAHVREPIAADLEAIAVDLGLKAKILGRNFLGLAHPNRLRRHAVGLADRALQRRPSLCSDLYLVGTKDP